MRSANSVVPDHLKPRKSPIQARSSATVEAIYEAMIQVLIEHGVAHLTTTRVAARAGVSVGTLYQYFPNKQALLFAILQRYFSEMAEAFESLSNGSGKRPLGEVADSLADVYVSKKIARLDATTALYSVAAALDQNRISDGAYERIETAVVRVLSQASDATFKDANRTAFTLLAAWNGLSRVTFGSLVSRKAVLVRFREEASLISRAYLTAAADRLG